MKKLYDLYIKPYTMWIKPILLVLLFGAGVLLGFRLDPEQDCGQLDAETATELATCKSANAEYERLFGLRSAGITDQQDEYRLDNEAEVKAARVREADLKKQLAAAKEEMRNARTKPECAELLELQICEAISLPLQP